MTDQVRQNLGVRGGMKLVPGFHQALFQAVEVFDHTIMDNGDPPGLIKVGMGVFIIRRTVGGPTGMSDADLSRKRLVIKQVSQALVDLALLLPGMEAGCLQDSKSSTVVSAIFKPSQPFQKNGRGMTRTDISNNSTHE